MKTLKRFLTIPFLAMLSASIAAPNAWARPGGGGDGGHGGGGMHGGTFHGSGGGFRGGSMGSGFSGNRFSTRSDFSVHQRAMVDRPQFNRDFHRDSRDFDRDFRRPEFRGHAFEHRRDFEERHHDRFFFSGPSLGFFFPVLPPGCVTVYAGGFPYYYDGAAYYEPASSGSGYAMVTPPIGAVVTELPPNAIVITIGTTYYYYSGGAFYVQVANGFQVVEAPIGVSLSTLPPGAVPVTVNGVVYYSANGVYYRPGVLNGARVYTIVRLS